MSYIIAIIRNDQGVSMPSVDGELVIVLLTSDGQFIAQQPVTISAGDAIFANLPAGRYTMIARHPSLNPTEGKTRLNLAGERDAWRKILLPGR